MAIRSERNIYQLLEKYLRATEQPLTCVDLMEIDAIKYEAEKEFGRDSATNKLSDTLGFMWRRELLTRYPAPKTETSFARYAYTWDDSKTGKPLSQVNAKVKTLSRYDCTITKDEGGVTLEFDKFSILIRPKK